MSATVPSLGEAAERLLHPVVMPGVEQVVADRLADEQPELANQIAGLLEYESMTNRLFPSLVMPERNRRLGIIAHTLLQQV